MSASSRRTGTFSSNFISSKKQVSFEKSDISPKISRFFTGRMSTTTPPTVASGDNSKNFQFSLADTQIEKSCDYGESGCLINENIPLQGSKSVSMPGNDILFCVTPRDNSQLNVDHLDDTRILMMSIISSPVSLGYFLSFCESEFKSEYLKFFIAVERFRTTIGEDPVKYLVLDKKKNKYQWDSDEIIDETGNVSPSELTKFLEINQRWKSEIFEIWDQFLDDKDGRLNKVNNGFLPSICHDSEPNVQYLSPHFVSLPQIVYTNIRKRMNQFDKYGGNIFKEAVIAVLTILHQDMLPRFCASGAYVRNLEKGRLVIDLDHVFLPSINTLVVKPPNSKIIEDLSRNIMYTEGKLYNLEEVLNERLLYSIFLTELKESGSEGSLLCHRMISIFKANFKKKVSPINPEIIEDQIWKIYVHFIAIGSSCEFCLTSVLRKSLMLSFGSPSEDMFIEFEDKIMVDLTEKFENYKRKFGYQLMADRALDTARKILQIELGVSGILKPFHECSIESELAVEGEPME